jgi:hypothetical protein
VDDVQRLAAQLVELVVVRLVDHALDRTRAQQHRRWKVTTTHDRRRATNGIALPARLRSYGARSIVVGTLCSTLHGTRTAATS